MAKEHEKLGRSSTASVRPADSRGFAKSLEQRRQAAQGLEQDLLTDVPLLYGSPGSLEPHGDPGIVLARVHREDLLRRNGGGVLQSSSRQSDVALPFERTTAALAVLLFLFVLFGNLD